MASLSQFLRLLAEDLQAGKEECTQAFSEQTAWLDEAVKANTKRLLYKSSHEFECPRSHRKPTRAKRKAGLTAVSEEPEGKENVNANLEERSAVRRALAPCNNSRVPQEEVGGKRKSDGEGDETETKQARDDTKRIHRDQLAEINAAAALAASPRIAPSRTTMLESNSEVAPDYSQMRVPELRATLETLGLSNHGKKEDLITRLKVADLKASKTTVTELKSKKMKVSELKAILREMALPEDGKMVELMDRLEAHLEHENEISSRSHQAAGGDALAASESEEQQIERPVEASDEKAKTPGKQEESIIQENDRGEESLPEGAELGTPAPDATPALGLSLPDKEVPLDKSFRFESPALSGSRSVRKNVGKSGVAIGGALMDHTTEEAAGDEVSEVEAEVEVDEKVASPGNAVDLASQMDSKSVAEEQVQGGEDVPHEELEADELVPAAVESREDKDAHMSVAARAIALENSLQAAKPKSVKLQPRVHVSSPAVGGRHPLGTGGGYAMCDELQRKLQARQARHNQPAPLCAVSEADEPEAAEPERCEPQHTKAGVAREGEEKRRGGEMRMKEGAELRRAKEAAVKEAAEQKKREEKEAAEQKLRAKELAAEQRAKEAAEQRRRDKEAAELKAKEVAELRAKKAKAEEKRVEEKRALLEKRREEKEKEERKEVPKKLTRKSQVAGAQSSQSKPLLLTPKLPTGWSEYYDRNTGREYFYHASSKTTTWSRPGMEASKKRDLSSDSSASHQYPIDETKPESNSEEESESEDEQPLAKMPRWVSNAMLMPQIEVQQSIDADAIFGQQIHRQEVPCDLEEVFGRVEPKMRERYHRRTSSGCWDQDKLTTHEEHIYKTSLGFFR